MLEDKLLVLKLKYGDRDALRRIYEKYKDDLLSIASSLLDETGAAEDVLHDVFVSLAGGMERLHLYGSLKNYLIICIINGVRDRLHSKMYQVVGLDSTGPLSSSNSDRPMQPVTNGEESQSLADALAQLPYQQREVIILYLQGGMKFSEIADVQNISSNTVQSRYRYGLDKLRTILTGEVTE